MSYFTILIFPLLDWVYLLASMNSCLHTYKADFQPQCKRIKDKKSEIVSVCVDLCHLNACSPGPDCFNWACFAPRHTDRYFIVALTICTNSSSDMTMTGPYFSVTALLLYLAINTASQTRLGKIQNLFGQ